MTLFRCTMNMPVRAAMRPLPSSTRICPLSQPARRQFRLSPSTRKEYPQELSTDDSVKTDAYGDKEHAIKKAKQGDDLDVQTDNLKKGVDAQDGGSGGHATERRDSAQGKAKAKAEHPEAPDVAIGMQDERGGRGA